MVRSENKGQDLSLRLARIQEEISSLFSQLELSEMDFLLCEGPAPLVLNPNSAVKVERVRSIFETLGRSAGLTVPGRLNPRTIHVEMLGLRGKQLARKAVKECARQVVERLYGSKLPNLVAANPSLSKKLLSQDIVDALLIGAVASAKLSQALIAKVDPYELFAVRRSTKGRRSSSNIQVRWTETDLLKVLGK